MKLIRLSQIILYVTVVTKFTTKCSQFSALKTAEQSYSDDPVCCSPLSSSPNQRNPEQDRRNVVPAKQSSQLISPSGQNVASNTTAATADLTSWLRHGKLCAVKRKAPTSGWEMLSGLLSAHALQQIHASLVGKKHLLTLPQIHIMYALS